MRVDKYLWCVRYFKTRSEASKACRAGQVKVNGDSVKPSRDIYPQDRITVRKNQINLELVVNDLPDSRVGAKIVDLYRKDVTPEEAYKAQEMLRHAKTHYGKKGTGRPTKKDRRDMDQYYDENS